ncbi:MAG: NAD(P)H-hydrate dehydratase [Bacteroidales bacterium]|nr:NAD(P)H-hydrate dehydratase [Bacteroidales bacterium]
MKILPIDKIREADAYTIENEPIADIDLMERATRKLFKWIKKQVDVSQRIFVFAGLGNNGGDGMALARMLTDAGYEVFAYVVRYSKTYSASFAENYNRYLEMSHDTLFDLEMEEDFPGIEEDDIIVDALFGSGLTRPLEGLTAKVIQLMNQSPAVKIAIDIPSGLNADQTSRESHGNILQADYTLTFQFPKYAFLLPENDQYVGEWYVLDIGLHPDFIEDVEVDNFFLLKQDVEQLIKPRAKFSHKGTYGHALLIAGGYGKMGAAILAAHACLRSGTGLLHVHVPKVGYPIMQTALPEAMISIDRNDYYFTEVPDLSTYNVIGIGPGMGKESQSQTAMKLLIQEYRRPMVIDADALGILAENKTWLSFLPPNSILTPHPKEFERLAGTWKNDFEKMDLARSFCKKFQVILVLKGANTSICLPDGRCYFNSTGNPGMATAGSGDVLTGIITGLLAQNYSPIHAALLGVYLHGSAGDIAAEKNSEESLIAGDITMNLGKAFHRLIQ